jgi:hypothetical protein
MGGASRTVHIFVRLGLVFSLSAQATAVWQWSNFLHAQVPNGKIVLRINMDETSIKLHQTARGGHMTWKAVLLKRSALSLTKNVTRGEMRSSFTHVAFICDDVNIQRKLPQIFLVGERHISVADAERVHQELAPNIHVWRVKKAWVNSLLMQEIVKLLARTLDEHRSTHQCILYADVFRAHLTPPVLRCVTNASIFYCLVPSKLTWALQPCDTHMFATFKAFLSNFCVEHASERDDGKMTTVDILWCVAATSGAGSAPVACCFRARWF